MLDDNCYRIKKRGEKIKEFNDTDFIPDDGFRNSIDDNSPLIILKYIYDGDICSHYYSKEGTDYLKLVQQTNNKFLKLAYFKCLKRKISHEEQKRILNIEKLIPLFHEVAVNIVKQRNPSYRPMRLAKDYINLAHPNIPNQQMFQNVGHILMLIISDPDKTHIDDMFFLLKEFLGLKKKILHSATIPDDIFNAIDYWINDVFDGNLTHYDFSGVLLDKIFDFYKEVDRECNSRKEIIFTKYKRFYDDIIKPEEIDLGDIGSIENHKRFIKILRDITQKYCVNEEIKDKLAETLEVKYENLNRHAPIALNNLPPITGTISYSLTEIENALKPFKNDTIQEFMRKIVMDECFIPDIPDIKNIDIGLTDVFATRVFDGSNIRYYDAGDSIFRRTGYYKIEAYRLLMLLEHKLKDYDKYQVLGNIHAVIQLSELIDDISKRMFFKSLEHFGREDYFHSIQISIFQIERILRTLCYKNEILNLFKDDKKEIHKGIDYMLRKLKERNILSEKLLFFMGWLLSSLDSTNIKVIPENIRNKIAHGLDDLDSFNDIYTKYNALSIILIYLSLSKA